MPVASSNLRPYNADLLLTPQELKNIYLFGVNQTDDDGNAYPDEMYEFYIRAAQEWLESELGGIALTDTLISNEVHDYYMNDYYSFGFMKLFRFPVTSVTSVSIQFPLTASTLSFDPSWFRINGPSGQLNLIPTVGTISQLLMGNGGNYLPLLNGLDIPCIWQVTYNAGFAKDKVPYLIKHIVGMKAAMGPLNVAGDLLAGAGVSSKSLSLDGISQSISTTSSPSFAGYGARILNYNKEITSALSKLRGLYGGIGMVVA